MYYPFIAFFTIFSHVSTHPASATSEMDLELLKATVLYFRNMKNQLTSPSSVPAKLEKTVNVFHS